MILAIDPGPEKSAWVRYSPRAMIIHDVAIDENDTVATIANNHASDAGCEIAIEMIASYGMAVGASVFETCVWIGRFVEASNGNAALVYRKEVKLHLCGTLRAKDANIRQALMDKFPRTGGGKTPQVGIKSQPGPLYGVKSHIWSALAVAVTYAEAER